ncbi:cysteine hydrolase [Dyadobacter sp. CY327]|uniref:cysteine hydrolase family protein n=1 Tax=Dyadobacter sp. CY327 TaxID=2907301 RepID=UPI001F23B484|nr:isochorismatase family cysteine hydrolase [Dyadobacter sp. CY327]MCE7072583.1 cysteine hydrolase [Dyadobacter sp. CY327]
MERKALLVIDVQEDFTGPQARLPVNVVQGKKMITNINLIVELARDLNFTVIYIGNEFNKYDLLNIFHRFAAIRDTPGAALDKRLEIVSPYYFSKSKDDAFSNPDLLSFLKAQGIHTVVLTGVFAEGCIWATLKGAQHYGFFTEVAVDAIAAKTDRKLGKMLKKYVESGAKLISSF